MIANSRRTRGRNRKRVGATIVETALIAPLCLLLIVSTIDLGRFYLIRNTVDEAAKLAVSPGAPTDQVTARAKEVLELLRTKGTVVVTPSQLDLSMESVTVRIGVPMKDNSFFLKTLQRYIVGECTRRAQPIQIMQGDEEGNLQG